MTNVLQTGSVWLADQLFRHGSRFVRYRRGILEVSVPAVIGRTQLQVQDEFGNVRLEWTDRDFLIRASDLVLDGNPVQPERGDQILETDGPLTFRYEVLAPNQESPWRWADGYYGVYRIHTKLVRVES